MNNPNAKQANDFLDEFPPEAKQEILEIVMAIMREQKENAAKHTNAYKGAGAKAAYQSFSPDIQKRIDALSGKLSANKSFNNKQKLDKMNAHKPGIK